MEAILLPLFLLLVAALAYKLYQFNAAYKKRPPSPFSLPLLGHLHLMKQPVHRTLYKISQRYGPVFSFRLGAHPAVIVSSSSAADECFTKNDVVLANRPTFNSLAQHLSYNSSLLSIVSYGDRWRNLRRIGALEIYSGHRINLFQRDREDEIKRMLKNLYQRSGQDFAKVKLKSLLTDLTFNVIAKMVAGKRYYGDVDAASVDEALEFKHLMSDIFSRGGVANIEDFLPILSWINGGKHKKEVKALAERTDKFLQRLIEEHRRKGKRSEEDDATPSTLIDRLQCMQESEPENYTDDTIKGLTLTILLGGTDSSAVTLEWAMSNLVNHPSILEKARKEIDTRIGDGRLLCESDLPDLPFLQAIISETLRLHPAAPLLLPHYSSEDFTISGFNVPRHTTLLVNVWAIQRDPAIWNDPESYVPERFEGDGAQDFQKMMPFGLGRRACPGSSLAQRVMGLALGSLIQCFEWRRIGEEMVDMSEGKGSVVPKAEPLVVEFRTRHVVKKLLSGMAFG